MRNELAGPAEAVAWDKLKNKYHKSGWGDQEFSLDIIVEGVRDEIKKQCRNHR